jgi:hypothetical protein
MTVRFFLVVTLVLFTLLNETCINTKAALHIPPLLNGKFINLKPNSSWIYITTGAVTDTNKTVIIDSIQNAFGKNFQIFHSHSSSGYIGRGGSTFLNGNYYSLNKAPNGTFFESNYLKDSNEVGKKWTEVLKIGTITSYNTYEVIDNNLSKIIRGRRYSNVIHIRGKSTYSNSDNYYAPYVGLIETNFTVNSTKCSVQLMDYNLK